MFNQARIKLTVFYLLIIMIISSIFSVVIYELVTQEFDRIERMNHLRMERDAVFLQLQPSGRKVIFISPETIQDSKNRLKLMLLAINLGILTFSAFAGYYLAGRTLKPIKEMVDNQNRFITDASHELKTPLTALKTEIEVALRDKKLSLKNARQLLSSNLEEVNSLQNLSESLIRLSQNNLNPHNQLIEKISVKEESETAVKKVLALAKQKNILIDNKIGRQVVNCESGNITELLVIFLDNAIKYSPEKTSVKLLSGAADGFIFISIIDQGIGIPKPDLPFLFERFFRSDKSRSKQGADGFGLGLSIAKKIIEDLNGKIEIHSEENNGTTFTLRFPKV